MIGEFNAIIYIYFISYQDVESFVYKTYNIYVKFGKIVNDIFFP